LNSLGYTMQDEVICDSAEPKSIEELRRCGINAVGADKKPGSIMAGIDFLKKHKVLVSKSSRNIIKENKYYQWMQSKDGKFINKPKDWMNHAIDACRYAYSLGDMMGGNNSFWVDPDDI